MAELDARVREAGSPGPAWRLVPRATWLLGTIGLLVAEASSGERTARACGARAQRTASALLRGHGVAVRRVGTVPGGPVIIASNHLGYLDPLVIASLVPCISIAKAESAAWPVIGAGLRALGVVFVRRGDVFSRAIALRRALRALRTGASVLNFPEGTTSDGSSVRPFHSGGFGLSRLAGVPVVPARITYDDHRVPWFGDQRFYPHYVCLARVPTVVARVAFGEPVVLGRGDDIDDFGRRVRRMVAAL